MTLFRVLLATLWWFGLLLTWKVKKFLIFTHRHAIDEEDHKDNKGQKAENKWPWDAQPPLMCLHCKPLCFRFRGICRKDEKIVRPGYLSLDSIFWATQGSCTICNLAIIWVPKADLNNGTSSWHASVSEGYFTRSYP